MKKKIKTYGVRGLMECVCNIPVGKTRLHVEFTGGVLTQYGNTPAKYSTDDLLKQAIIENSKPFKSGKIVLVSTVESDEDETMRVEGKVTGAETPAEGGRAQDSGDGTGSKDVQGSADGTDGTSAAGSGETVVEVASLEDAKDYLNQKHGVAVRNLRSRQAILDAAKQYGVTFKGL